MYKAIYSKFFCRHILTAAILIFVSTYSFGQDKPENKLDKVKGNVEKITIKTDKGTFIFEGKEAKDLFKKMESSKAKSFRFFGSGDDSDAHVFIIKLSKIDKDFSFFSDEIKDGNKVEIKIDNKDGDKIVTVTTIDKDGEEKTETYKGKEADEFLKENGSKKFNLRWLDEDDKDGNVFFLLKSDNDNSDDDCDIMMWSAGDSAKSFSFRTDTDGKGMEKIIKATEDNGEKSVTVKTIDKDGKEKTETFKGKDAEEYLKKNDMKLRIKVEGDKDGKVEEIIIKKRQKK